MKGFLTLKFSAWLGVAAIIVALFVLNAMLYSRIEVLQAENKTLAAEASSAATANDGQRATIAAMRAALEQWTALYDAQAERATMALRSAENAGIALRNTERKLTELEKKDYASPDCNALLATDFAAACPAMAAGLRERAAAEDR